MQKDFCISPRNKSLSVITSLRSVYSPSDAPVRWHAREVRAVIKIRYSDLPAGLHLSAEVRGKHTVLFLLPGLTAPQRKAALRRARSAARVGHGPALPALGLARAVAADRIATTVRNGLAATRMHPAIFIPPMIIMVSVAITYVLLVSFSIRFLPPQSEPRLVLPNSGRGAVHSPRTADPGSRPASGAEPGSPGTDGPAPSSSGRPGSRSPGPSAWPSPATSGRRPSGSPSPSAPAPSRSPDPSRSPGPSPSAPPAPDPGSSSGGSGVCLKVGLLGVCVPL
jgi:hypothetical protein